MSLMVEKIRRYWVTYRYFSLGIYMYIQPGFHGKLWNASDS